MENNFMNLDKEKRDRIINAALTEFGKNTFQKASTNTIVKNAGISKGTLFNYFNTKQDLYDYLVKFSFESMIDIVLTKVNLSNTDLFDRIKEIGLAKFQFVSVYPGIIAFSGKLYEGKSTEEIKDIAKEFSPDIYKRIYSENIDFSRFRDGIDIGKAIQITQWTIEKVGESQLHNYPDGDTKEAYLKVVDEIDSYLVILKKSFYKEEYYD